MTLRISGRLDIRTEFLLEKYCHGLCLKKLRGWATRACQALNWAIDKKRASRAQGVHRDLGEHERFQDLTIAVSLLRKCHTAVAACFREDHMEARFWSGDRTSDRDEVSRISLIPVFSTQTLGTGCESS